MEELTLPGLADTRPRTPSVVGLDLSLTSTGIAFADGSTAVVRPKNRGAERLLSIEEVLLASCAGADLVVIEGYSFNSRSSQSHSIGELGGVIKAALCRKGTPYALVPPACRAKFGSGKGNAKKSEVVSAWTLRTGIAFKYDDEVDAHILREMGLHHLGFPSIELPQVNRDALVKCEWPT